MVALLAFTVCIQLFWSVQSVVQSTYTSSDLTPIHFSSETTSLTLNMYNKCSTFSAHQLSSTGINISTHCELSHCANWEMNGKFLLNESFCPIIYGDHILAIRWYCMVGSDNILCNVPCILVVTWFRPPQNDIAEVLTAFNITVIEEGRGRRGFCSGELEEKIP